MKLDLTNVELRATVFGILFAVVVFTALFSLTSCSSEVAENNSSNQTSYTGDKSFSFKEGGSNWRVDFDEEKISAVYKGGTRIPDDQIGQYKEMIYEKLDGLKQDYHKPSGNVHRLHFDMDNFNGEMKKFKDDFDRDSLMHFKIEFDEDEFEKNMEELGERLNDLKDKKIDLYFDSEDFKENMKELEENLKTLPAPPNPPDVDIDVYLDMDDFKEGLIKLGESFKHLDFKIDSSVFDMKDLHKNMKELEKNMKDLKIELHDIRGETKKLNSFLEELKTELVKDGYLNSVDEEYGLEMSKERTEINGKAVTQEHHNKYKEIYKRYFDKDLDGTIKIKKNDSH